jgi:recombinational DNA repair protein RecR
MIVWFEKPLREVEGHFRRCRQCGEWIKWHEDPCRYCQGSQTPPPPDLPGDTRA